MVSRIFISWICHFWARFWLNFNFGDFRAYFAYFFLVKIDFFEVYFQSWRIKLRVLKFFRPILIIKRHQKNTQAKLFKNLPHDNTLYAFYGHDMQGSVRNQKSKLRLGHLDFNRKLNFRPDLFSSIFWFEHSLRSENAILYFALFTMEKCPK